MGSGASYESSSPEPDSSDPTELAMLILNQKPLRLVQVQMLRLCRLINDYKPEDKLELFHAGVLKHMINILTELVGANRAYAETSVRGKSTKQKKKRPVSSARPVKGVGYGSGSIKSHWNMQRSVESRLVQEEQMVWVLNCLSAYCFKASPDFSNPDAILAYYQRKPLPHIVNAVGIKDIILTSKVMDIIRANLINDSLLDISHHLDLYQSIMEALCSMAIHSTLITPLIESTPDQKSILDIIRVFRGSLQSYTSTSAGHICSPDLRLMDFILKVDVWLDLLEKANCMYGRKLHRSSSVPSLLNNYTPPMSVRAMDDESVNLHPTTSSNENPHPTNPDKDQVYVEELKELQLSQWKFIGDFGKLTVNYSFRKEVRSINPFSPALKDRAKRIAKELASLPQSLPLSCSSSIFVCVDEGRCDIMKVLISGPVGTPYEMGLYEFDVFFPSNYPTNPPKVSFVTTGGGNVRFNPNLYADGKVCLSILGTWEGRPEEKWNPHCTLLQLLISIQALIFVKDPYYNEPGLERFLGSSNTTSEFSHKYNLQIQHASMKWAIKAQLECPPPYFKTIIYRHFFVLRGLIIEQANRWLELYKMDMQRSNATKSTKHNDLSHLLDYGPVFVQGMDKTLIDLIKILLHHNKDIQDKLKEDTEE